MIREIIKKIKEKKQKEIEEQSTSKIHVGMTVCAKRWNCNTNLSRAEIGVVVAVDSYSGETFLVKFKDGSVDSYNVDAIYTDYDKELLK